ncbi:UPF0182 family protein [Williamsia sterculiae]|uniref:UPF0182 family protein n=1 Tax=Williamsia sterculiae TaxID=1344003 RepID=UPI000970A559|nr:UPF0182 family protein [Williamsia sterculiae]
MGVRGPAGMPTLSRRGKILISIAVVVLVVLLVGPRFIGLYTDWLWFDDIGYRNVFSTILWTRILLFLVAAVISAGIFFAGMALAYRSRPVFVPTSGAGDPIARYRAVVMARIRWFAIIPPAFVGLISGLVAQGSWATVQTYLHGTSFGQKDPQFGIDVGFFAFDLPFYRFIINFLFVILVITFLVNALTHYIFGGIRLAGRAGALTTATRIQLGVIAGLFVLLKAVAYWFDRYTLLSSTRKQDIFTGMGYTDAHAVLPSKLILMAIAIICALAFFAGIVLRDLRVPALATVLMLLSALVIGVGWPLIMEQFSVKPNAAQKESEYIQRNINATRLAYGIGDQKVTYDRNWTAEPTDPAVVNDDTATLSNIRLLDPNVIEPAFTQRQKLKNFYGFPSQLAVDRYTVNGQERDFVVAARELDPSKFDANQQNWLNKHTVFTHGNGFIAAPANTVDEASSDAESDRGGLPVFEVSDLENYRTADYQKTAPIKVTQPRIYFGELISKVNPDYAIVGSTNGDQKEYDQDGASFTYNGGGGVSLGNWFNRLAYSVKYTERNILLSGAINRNSKILYNRDPRDRVKKAAPWLTVDSKTYPAVMADGSIKWIVDGYTTLDNYPYAQKTSLQNVTTDAQELNQGQTGRTQTNREVSYVRNSVKATVDAYTGKVTLYQFDDTDPVLKTWMKVFPGTVKSKAEFNADQSLRSHIRYPEDLFKIQRALLSKYHVNDPGTFFRSNDFWSIPADPTKDDATAQGLNQPPYYLMAADPKTLQPSFQLTTVMNGLNSGYLAAYMTASSDPDNYGQITVKALPTTKQTVGPRQAQENMKSAGPVASDRKQVEDTTRVTYGNLLTLPVGRNGILYVEPMYTQAKTDDAAIPKLYRVLVYYNGNVGYASTVAGALQQVGISSAAATKPDQDNSSGQQQQPTTQQPTTQQPSQAGTTTPPSSTQNSTVQQQRDAAVTAIGKALDDLKTAQSSGDLGKIGAAISELDRARNQYEAVPTS